MGILTFGPTNWKYNIWCVLKGFDMINFKSLQTFSFFFFSVASITINSNFCVLEQTSTESIYVHFYTYIYSRWWYILLVGYILSYWSTLSLHFGILLKNLSSGLLEHFEHIIYHFTKSRIEIALVCQMIKTSEQFFEFWYEENSPVFSVL